MSAGDLGLKSSVSTQWRPQERHIVVGKDQGDSLGIGLYHFASQGPTPQRIPPTARGIDHDELAWRICDIHEGVWHTGR